MIKLKNDFFIAEVVLLAIFAFGALSFGAVQAEDQEEESSIITIHNMANAPIHVATYCTSLSGSSKRTSPVQVIASDSLIQMPRTKRTLSCSRHLYFSYHTTDLTETIDKKSTVGRTGLGTTSAGGRIANSFYILPIKGKLHGYNSITINAKNMLLKLTAMLQATLQAALAGVTKNSPLLQDGLHKDDTAQVRISTAPPQEEIEFIAKRKVLVKQALERLTGRKLNGSYIPTIACVSSGGGARALISSLGFHVGLQETGLLDTLSYDVGLSGGSWFVMLWHQSNTSPAEFKKRMQPIAAKGLNPTRKADFNLQDVRRVSDGLLVRKAVNQPTTMVTLWGSLLANRYLMPYEPRSQAIRFSSLLDQPNAHQRPFPLVAAINGYAADMGVDKHLMEWFEISPVEAAGVGSWLGNAGIPTWSFGRRFENNVSITDQPEYDMGQLMGISGSAFAVTIGRAFAEMPIISLPAHYLLKATIGQDLTATKRVSVGKVPNFTQQIPNSTIRGSKDLRLVDAGMAINIPTPLVLHDKRRADIIIICDASGSLTKDNAQGTMGGTQRYAQHHNLPLPPFDFTNITKQALSIFSDNSNPHVPLVIYMPRIVDRKNITYPSFIPRGYNTDISTMQFQYDASEFNNLSGVTQANVVGSKQKIIDAIIKNIELNGGFE